MGNRSAVIMATCWAALQCAAGDGRAASFDCAKARSQMERMVCSDPRLSRADEQLRDRLAGQTLHAVSEEGRRDFREGQRQWLASMGIACLDSHSRQAVNGRDCLQREYDLRVRQLTTAVQQFGSVTIRRVETFSASAAADTDDGAVTVTVAMPRIDNPATPSQRAWNATMAEKIRSLATVSDANTDKMVDYEIRFAGSNFLSVTITDYEYAHGTPHGYGSESTVNWMLNNQREATIDDLFRGGRTDPALTTLGDQCKRQLQEHADAETGRIDKAVPSTVLDISAWQFLPSEAKGSLWTLRPRRLRARHRRMYSRIRDSSSDDPA